MPLSKCKKILGEGRTLAGVEDKTHKMVAINMDEQGRCTDQEGRSVNINRASLHYHPRFSAEICTRGDTVNSSNYTRLFRAAVWEGETHTYFPFESFSFYPTRREFFRYEVKSRHLIMAWQVLILNEKGEEKARYTDASPMYTIDLEDA
jgi:hypothetical protein